MLWQEARESQSARLWSLQSDENSRK